MCVDWQGSCNELCLYQEQWLEWPINHYLELDTLQCVQEWNSTTHIAIIDTQLGERPVCRSFQYFVDTDSQSVLELGTKQHPFKNLQFVFVELLNFHSHSDRSISVYCMENTTNYIMLSMAYIINITSVTILPYNNDNTEVTTKPTLIGQDAEILVPIRGTSFNILQNFDLRTADMIDNNPDITDIEKQEINQSSFLLLILRSSFYIDGFDLKTEYGSKINENAFFYYIHIQERQITMLNLNFEISGYTMQTRYPLNLYVEHIAVDYTQNIKGFMLEIDCNYPEANLEGLISIKNISAYYENDREINQTTGNFFSYNGPADLLIEDFDINVFSYTNEPYAQISVSTGDTWNSDNLDTIKYFNATNIGFRLTENSGNASTYMEINYASELYREIQVNISNFSWIDWLNSSNPPIISLGNSLASQTINGMHFYNSSSYAGLIWHQSWNSLTVNNILIQYYSSLSQYTIVAKSIMNLEIHNFTSTNSVFSNDWIDTL